MPHLCYVEVLGTEGTRKAWLEGRSLPAQGLGATWPLLGPFKLFLSHRCSYPHPTVWSAFWKDRLRILGSRGLRTQNPRHLRAGRGTACLGSTSSILSRWLPHQPRKPPVSLPPLPCIHPSSHNLDRGGQGPMKNTNAFLLRHVSFSVLGFSNEIQALGGSKPRAPIYNYLGTNWYKR